MQIVKRHAGPTVASMGSDDVVHQRPWEYGRKAPTERLRKGKLLDRERLREGKLQRSASERGKLRRTKERRRERKAPKERLRNDRKTLTERLRKGKAQRAPQKKESSTSASIVGEHTNGDCGKGGCFSRYDARLLAMRPWRKAQKECLGN
jgi:hypothetical protein